MSWGHDIDRGECGFWGAGIRHHTNRDEHNNQLWKQGKISARIALNRFSILPFYERFQEAIERWWDLEECTWGALVPRKQQHGCGVESKKRMGLLCCVCHLRGNFVCRRMARYNYFCRQREASYLFHVQEFSAHIVVLREASYLFRVEEFTVEKQFI